MDSPAVAITRSYLVRDRDAVATLTDFTPVVAEMELHYLTLGIQYDPFVLQLLTDGITGLALHLSSRPVDEHVAWDVSIQKPWPVNLFFAGSSRDDNVIARAYLEDIRPRDDNVLIARSRREFGKEQTSYVDFEGVDLFGMVEKYYQQSEQKRARFFHRKPMSAMLQALPGCDMEWLDRVDRDEVLALPEQPRVEPLADRPYRFLCGCSADRLARYLVGDPRSDEEALFGPDSELEATCGRCGSAFRITRDDYRRAQEALRR